MQTCEVARFEHAGDVRRMLVAQDGDDVVLREDLSGPSVLVAFGEERRSLRVTLSPEAVSALLVEIGFSGGADSLWSYLSDERHDLIDLMDLCDQRDIPYAFSSLGARDLQFRPAACALAS